MVLLSFFELLCSCTVLTHTPAGYFQVLPGHQDDASYQWPRHDCHVDRGIKGKEWSDVGLTCQLPHSISSQDRGFIFLCLRQPSLVCVWHYCHIYRLYSKAHYSVDWRYVVVCAFSHFMLKWFNKYFLQILPRLEYYEVCLHFTLFFLMVSGPAMMVNCNSESLGCTPVQKMKCTPPSLSPTPRHPHPIRKKHNKTGWNF